MSNTEFTPRSWHVAADTFSSVATGVPGAIQSVTASATDANAIGSASGISMFDTVVTGVLGAVAQIMDELGTGIQTGLASEGAALDSTGTAYSTTEADNTDSSSEILPGGH